MMCPTSWRRGTTRSAIQVRRRRGSVRGLSKWSTERGRTAVNANTRVVDLGSSEKGGRGEGQRYRYFKHKWVCHADLNGSSRPSSESTSRILSLNVEDGEQHERAGRMNKKEKKEVQEKGDNGGGDEEECENMLKRKKDLSNFVSPIRPNTNYYGFIDNKGKMRVNCPAEGEKNNDNNLAPTARASDAQEEEKATSEQRLAKASKLVGPVFKLKGRVQKYVGESELQELTRLAFPALAALLADPFMSLIDTACVGRLQSSDLSALGCNTAIFNLVFQLFTFLSVATTGSVARLTPVAEDSRSGEEEGGEEADTLNGDANNNNNNNNNNVVLSEAKAKRRRDVVTTAVCVATSLGVLATCALQVFAKPLLGFMGASSTLVGLGLPYLRIRALALPFVLVCTCAQGAFLGKQDSRTPLTVFLVAAFFNIVGDWLLVLPTPIGIPSMGLSGAALATLGAQILASSMFVSLLVRDKLLPTSLAEVKLPSRKDLSALLDVSGMLLLGSLCRMGVYTMMTTTATSMGITLSAAHQIGLQIFWTLTYFVDPLFVAATSFIARDVVHRPKRVLRMITLLLSLSSVVGLGIGIISGGLAYFGPSLFTSDPNVMASLRGLAPLMVVAQILSALVLVAEGILIGLGDLRYLLNVHCMNFVVLAAYLAIGYHCLNFGLAGVWAGVVLNQALRLIQHAGRVSSSSSPLPAFST